MWAWQGGEGLHFSAFSLYIYSAPDMPNFLSQYPMAAGTDYAQQTLASNAIDNEKMTTIQSEELSAMTSPSMMTCIWRMMNG